MIACPSLTSRFRPWISINQPTTWTTPLLLGIYWQAKTVTLLHASGRMLCTPQQSCLASQQAKSNLSLTAIPEATHHTLLTATDAACELLIARSLHDTWTFCQWSRPCHLFSTVSFHQSLLIQGVRKAISILSQVVVP